MYLLLSGSFSFAAFYIIWNAEGEEWFVKNAQWAYLVGFLRAQPPTGPSMIYYLATQVAISFVALAVTARIMFAQDALEDSLLGVVHASLDHLGSLLQLLCWLLLPSIQLVVGISNPSWASFPFCLCSCAGLIDWSLTSSFLGLFRWWRFLFRYAGLNIFLLYIYQLPIEWPESVVSIAQFVGLFKASSKSELSELCSGISLPLVLCFAVMKVLTGSANNFTIYNVYPRFFCVTGSGDVHPVEQAVDSVSGDLVLNRGNPEWWSFHDIDVPNVKGHGSLSGPTAIVVSEETPQGILGEMLSKFSIWGLYLTFVLAVGRFIRLQCADLRMRIPYENLPSCDRLLAICENIYTARAEDELKVEEVLYRTLVKIYRPSHMLLQYTKNEKNSFRDATPVISSRVRITLRRTIPTEEAQP